MAMEITHLHIEQFRSIKRLDVTLGSTTVFIGPNNGGKTAILDALRIALTRRWGQRGTGFTEYDVHLASEASDPKTSPGVVIELQAEERCPGDWNEDLQQALSEIIQTDPRSGKSTVTLRVRCEWSTTDRCFQPSWEFLNAARERLVGGSARRTNLEQFWKYLPVFYLDALRDVDDEFSSRSQFWGRLLKAMTIPAELETRVQRVLDRLNKRVLKADPRLQAIADSLSRATTVAARDRSGAAGLRALPLKSWDLLSKAEIIVRNESEWPWLPLTRQGQGLQSLSVIFLFRAFVDHMLSELYTPESTPVLALEEPETHLHPQAARALWLDVHALPGQKIITTHSPYFVQHVPFRDLRLVRLTERGTEVRWLPPSFFVTVPHAPELEGIAARSGGLIEYSRPEQLLRVNGKLPKDVYRELLTAYGTHPDRESAERVLADLRTRSLAYIPDEELRALETCARRIRGEIFFANKWLIVEGQAEYLLLHALAHALGYDLDEHGVSIIDAQNNGSPEMFASLARALGIPWLAVFDGDSAGHGYCRTIAARDFGAGEVARRCKTLPAGNLEQQLLADGLEADLRSVLQALGVHGADGVDRATLQKQLDENKTRYAAEFAKRLLRDQTLAPRMPEAFRSAIAELRSLI